jgi:hypothetical protein
MHYTTTSLWLGRDNEIEFQPVALRFGNGEFRAVFAAKNNKSVSETLGHRRYANLNEEITRQYSSFLDWPLGEFVRHLKESDDSFYRRFLNKYGDSTFCRFAITDDRYLSKKGLYVYTVERELRYIGRCKDTFKKRINYGYGQIHPKNCFLDGQATNCHLNALIAQCTETIALWIHPMTNDEEIEHTEIRLINLYNPAWNIALRAG